MSVCPTTSATEYSRCHSPEGLWEIPNHSPMTTTWPPTPRTPPHSIALGWGAPQTTQLQSTQTLREYVSLVPYGLVPYGLEKPKWAEGRMLMLLANVRSSRRKGGAGPHTCRKTMLPPSGGDGTMFRPAPNPDECCYRLLSVCDPENGDKCTIPKYQLHFRACIPGPKMFRHYWFYIYICRVCQYEW